MKAVIKLIPLSDKPKKGQAVAYSNVCNDMEAQDVFEYYGEYERMKDAVLLGRGELISASKLFQIVCEYRDGGTPHAGEDRSRLYEIPLHYDDYDSALSRMRKGETDMEIKLVDPFGMTNHNPDTSVAILIKDGYNSRSWDDIIQDIADKHKILIDHRIQDFLEENYYQPESKKYKERIK